MKKLNNFYLFAIVCICILFGCKKTKIDIITDGNYKFWYKYQTGWPDPFVRYYDTKGTWKVFELSNSFGLREYDGDDDILYEHWKLINDSTIEENGLIFKIKYISKDLMIRRTPAGTYDTLYAAPDSMIPDKFRHRW